LHVLHHDRNKLNSGSVCQAFYINRPNLITVKHDDTFAKYCILKLYSIEFVKHCCS